VALADLVDGLLRVELDASRLVSRGVSLGEAGLTTSYFPGKEERLLLDSSMRLMFDTPTVGIGSGWYADLFVDWVSMGGVVVSSGVHGVMERDEDFLDTGYGVLGRLSWHTGGKRSQRRSRTPWWGFAHRDGGS
jgi:hypothetical protein